MVSKFAEDNDWCLSSLSIYLAQNALYQKNQNKNETEKDAYQEILRNSKRNYQSYVANLDEDQKESLIPADNVKRNYQIKLLKDFLLEVKPFFDKTILYSSPREGHDLFLESLSLLENQLAKEGKFFGGKTPNFLDFGVFPYIEKIGKWIPEFAPSECMILKAWVRNMKSQPVVVEVFSGLKEEEENNRKLKYIEYLESNIL